MSKKKYIVMCVGHTHTGKSTFAKRLAKKVSSFVVIDNDEISAFVNKQYPIATASKYNQTRSLYSEPNMKLLLSKEVLKFCFRANVNIIQASAHLGSDARIYLRRLAAKYNYTLITVYFNLPMEEVEKRVKNTKKSSAVFVKSKSWQESLQRQLAYAQLPPSKKNTKFFEIKNIKDFDRVLIKVVKLVS